MADEQKPAGQENTDPSSQQTPEQIAAATEQKAVADKAAADAAAAAQSQVKPIAELQTATDTALEAYEKNPTPELKQAWLDAKKAEREGVAKDIESRKQADEKNKVPERYDLKKPEKSLLSDEQIAGIATFAKEQGLTNEKAQALVDRESQVISNTREAVRLESAATLESLQKTWIATAKDDKEIGGANFVQNAELSRRVLARYGTPEFSAILSDPKQGAFGNHPELVRVMTRIGKAMSEDQLVMPGAQGEKNNKPFADKFYETVTPSGAPQN